MKKNFKNELFILIFLIFIFIIIRSVNYIYHLNWSGDQASFATEALKIYRTKTLTLIGPQISANLNGRFIFQGPLIYYFFLLFLWLGHWEPVIASYLFTLFCSLMIIFLYYGTKQLINKKAAYIILIFYVFVPYYVNYTRFLWNSTILLSLLPILVFLMSLFKRKYNLPTFLFLSIWMGILLQFHYQFLIIIFAIFIYYFIYIKIKPIYLIYFIAGISIGFSPIIIFELKHQFYNFKTAILFIQNWSRIDRPGSFTEPHYYISVSFMAILIFLGIFSNVIKKINLKWIFIFALLTFTYTLYLNIPIPKASFWSYATPWNYMAEKKIYDIIQSTKIKNNFNIANLTYYDTKSVVVKYFMKRDSYQIDYEDYYHNKYLFVVTSGDQYLKARSYEVSLFLPRKLLKRWQINSKFDLLLLERG